MFFTISRPFFVLFLLAKFFWDVQYERCYDRYVSFCVFIYIVYKGLAKKIVVGIINITTIMTTPSQIYPKSLSDIP